MVSSEGLNLRDAVDKARHILEVHTLNDRFLVMMLGRSSLLLIIGTLVAPTR